MLLDPFFINLKKALINGNVFLFLKGIKYGYYIRSIYHTAWTRAAFVIIKLNTTEYGYLLTTSYWQCLIVILKKHHTLWDHLSCDLCIFLPVKCILHILLPYSWILWERQHIEYTSETGPGTLTAHGNFFLWLLHSCPDQIRRVPLRKTRTLRGKL